MSKLTVGDLIGRGSIQNLPRRLRRDAERGLAREAVELSMFLHARRLLDGLRVNKAEARDSAVGSYQNVLERIVAEPPECEELQEVLDYLTED